VLLCCDMYEYMIHSIYSSFPRNGGREIFWNIGLQIWSDGLPENDFITFCHDEILSCNCSQLFFFFSTSANFNFSFQQTQNKICPRHDNTSTYILFISYLKFQFQNLTKIGV
jgi:hypothetical protein